MPPKQTTEGEPTAGAAASGSPTRASTQPTMSDLALMLERMELKVDGLQETQAAADARIAGLTSRISTVERSRDQRAPSPDTVRRDQVESSTEFVADRQLPAPIARVLPPHITSVLQPIAEDSFADQSLSQRLIDPGVPDSDRMRILEENFEEQAARGGRKVENDALWRAAYEIVRRDNPGVNRAERFRLAKAIVDEQSLKFAATAPPPSRKFGAGSDKDDRLISLSGLQRITQLAEDTYEAWSDDLWSYLSSNPKARAMIFNNCSLGYDRRLDDELGGLLGLTVDNYYKKTTITVLRKQGETRGTVIFAQLKADVNRDSVSRRSLLRQKMLATVQKSAEGIQEYAERHRTLFAQLGNIDDTLNEPEKVEAFLKGLTPGFFGLKEALYTSQFTSGRALTLNETVNFMMTMEEKRTLSTMTAPPQVLPRFGARQAAVDVDEEAPNTLQLEHLTEEEAHAFVAHFNSKFRPGSRPGFGTRSSPPSGHPQEADWFAGECNFCLNPGHREARCRMRARLLDGAGPGSKYDKDVKPAARAVSGEDVMEEVDARLAPLFPQTYGSDSKVEARVGQALSGNLE